jgi:RNA polymerase sigma-70 factor (ECF subfamily)
MGERREAEDMSQDTFIRAHARLDTFDVERPFGPWIRRVATNVCLNRIKKFKPGQYQLDDELDEPIDVRNPGPEDQRIRVEREISVRSAIVELPPHYRAVIELRHFQDLTYAEISETLGISMSDVKSHLYRARRELAERLNVNGE